MLLVVAHTEELATSTGEGIRTINPTPSNIAAGITTLEEKSLGAIAKSGTTPLMGMLRYGERPPGTSIGIDKTLFERRLGEQRRPGTRHLLDPSAEKDTP